MGCCGLLSRKWSLDLTACSSLNQRNAFRIFLVVFSFSRHLTHCSVSDTPHCHKYYTWLKPNGAFSYKWVVLASLCFCCMTICQREDVECLLTENELKFRLSIDYIFFPKGSTKESFQSHCSTCSVDPH